MTSVRIEPAGNHDLGWLTAFLDAGYLPTDALGEHRLQSTLVARDPAGMTAAEFFARCFGFRPMVRAEVPVAVQQSVEFRSACPQTAQAMVREVGR